MRLTFLKKNIEKSTVEITKGEGKPSIKRQCELLGVPRSSVYYHPVMPSPETIEREDLIKQRLDFWHTKHCCFGVRSLRNKLHKEDNLLVGHKRIRRYMREMGIYAVYPKPNTSEPNKQHRKFLYLVKKEEICMANQVWAVDITYIKMGRRHMYLTAIIDWFSRFIVGWALSDTLETAPVLEAVQSAIEQYGAPGMINSDQGSQFTSTDYTNLLEQSRIQQSMVSDLWSGAEPDGSIM